MNATQKNQRAFIAVTMMTVLAVTVVFMVYAALLGTYPGAEVTVNEMGGTIYYNSPDVGSDWTTTISIGNGTTWYARLNVSNTPSQNVSVTWTLEENNGTAWNTVSGPSPPTTNIQLTGANTAIYVTDWGTSSGNYDWSPDTKTAGTFRVKAVING
jgi:hypothetical protein